MFVSRNIVDVEEMFTIRGNAKQEHFLWVGLEGHQPLYASPSWDRPSEPWPLVLSSGVKQPVQVERSIQKARQSIIRRLQRPGDEELIEILEGKRLRPVFLNLSLGHEPQLVWRVGQDTWFKEDAVDLPKVMSFAPIAPEDVPR